MGAKIDEKIINQTEFRGHEIMPGMTFGREIHVPEILAPQAKTIQNLDINHQIGVLRKKKLLFS